MEIQEKKKKTNVNKVPNWNFKGKNCQSVSQFNHSVMCNSLQPHELQHTRPPCPSLTPGVHPNPRPLSRDAIQPSYPLSSPSPPALNLFQHQGPFKWVSSSHQVAKVLNCNFKTTEKPTSAFQCCVAFYFYLFIATIASLIFWFLLQWTRINEILCFRMAFLLCIINFYFMCLHYFIVLRYFIIA